MRCHLVDRFNSWLSGVFPTEVEMLRQINEDQAATIKAMRVTQAAQKALYKDAAVRAVIAEGRAAELERENERLRLQLARLSHPSRGPQEGEK